MKEKPDKKIFGLPKPWKPLSLHPKPVLPRLPPAESYKALKPAHTGGNYPRKIFEPVISRFAELDKFATEITFRLRDADGEREIKSCYGDIYKIINALMDYARLLELVCDEWNLQAYHRAVYELHAEKLRAIAKKYQEAIGYNYDAAVARCRDKKKRAGRDEDIGGDALDLAAKQESKEKEK